MKNTVLSAFMLILSVMAYAQKNKKVDVLTLGTFHFTFPNLDVQQIAKGNQIDVFETKYQKEINDIIKKLEQFKPTIIVIERQPEQQLKIDSLYNEYIKGNYQLGRDEDQQIGFRLAKRLHLKKLYCVDEWGNFNSNIEPIISGKDSLEAKKFETFFVNDPDIKKKFSLKQVFKQKGILSELIQINDEVNIKKSLGNYLIGLFKYESKNNDFFGVDFETGRWFNRNLKIFRNIQRIETKPTDKILVIYGSGHLQSIELLF
ncbi:DUF5694 domain-containing protein [Flavobacterium aestivum]|uniref:DUF5694 domain-containing protein n=1 Tax=Flavobacterium aestivum TaxID=3003257 RepID=UPI0024822DFB|nr:DUF5694 domain-containing protein [Flavobacterium aestivum]